MAKKKRPYNFGMVAQSGSRVLSVLEYKNQTYGEMVTTEIIAAVAMLRAGVAMAEAKGEEIPSQVKAMIGM